MDAQVGSVLHPRVLENPSAAAGRCLASEAKVLVLFDDQMDWIGTARNLLRVVG